MKFEIHCLAIVVLTVAAAASSITTVAAEPERGMEEMIQTAKSKADHEAIAARYEAEAKELLVQAESYVRMAKLYTGMEVGGGKGPELARHCEELRADLRAAAGQNEDLARLHRELAAQATR